MHLLKLFDYSTLLAAATLAHPALGATSSTKAAPPKPESWDEALSKARSFVAKLTTDEKIGLVTGGYTQPSLPCVGSVGGIERLEFDGLCFSDGPAGYSRSDGVSVFASGITVAATWDRDLMYKRGVALGEEFRAKGAHVHLGYVVYCVYYDTLLTATSSKDLPRDPWDATPSADVTGRVSGLTPIWRALQ